MMYAILVGLFFTASHTIGHAFAVSSSKTAVDSNTMAVESSSRTKFLEPIHVFSSTSSNSDNIKADGKEKDVKKEEDAQKQLLKDPAKQKDLVKQWFTWPFWRLLVACSVVLLSFTELIFPLVFSVLGRTLLIAAVLFFLQNFAFLCTAIAFVTPVAAGATLCLVLSVILCAISLLIFLGVLGWQFKGKPTKSIELLQVDLTYIFKPISIVAIVFLIVQGLVDSSGSNWGEIAMFASFVALGVGFAVAGPLTDMMSYCFIRANDYFHEGEFIESGGLLQIKQVFWCYTYAYSPATRSDVYIPNGKLLGGAINNRSRDNSRTADIDLDIPMEKSKKIITDIQALLKKCDESGFESITGKKFEGQIDVAKTSIFLTAMDPGGDSCSMKIKLFGKYFFSKPPQWKMSGPEPERVARQMEWQAGWNYQIEWLLVESKKIISNA